MNIFQTTGFQITHKISIIQYKLTSTHPQLHNHRIGIVFLLFSARIYKIYTNVVHSVALITLLSAHHCGAYVDSKSYLAVMSQHKDLLEY